MKPRFFDKLTGIKPSERTVIRKGAQRIETAIRGRNLKAIEYGKVLQAGLDKFFAAVMESNTSDMEHPDFKHQMQVAVRAVFSKWVDEPPVKHWHWLKNRSRFDYTIEFRPQQNEVEVQWGIQLRLFSAGEINDFGEIIGRIDLDRWDAAHKEKENVQTSEANDG